MTDSNNAIRDAIEQWFPDSKIVYDDADYFYFTTTGLSFSARFMYNEWRFSVKDYQNGKNIFGEVDEEYIHTGRLADLPTTLCEMRQIASTLRST